MALQHPAERSQETRRGRFEQLAEHASFLVSSPQFFVLCLLVILAWALGLILGASDRFESTVVGLMSALTLILLALLKNAELRAESAIQQKLDAIAGALLEDRRGSSAAGPAEAQLERSIGVHDEI